MQQLRPAEADDYPFYAALFPELRVPDQPPSRERFETEMLAGSFVAIDAGERTGFLYVQVFEGVGYIRQVLVDPRARRRGFGRVLMDTAIAHFVERDCATFCLNVKPDNVPAITLYESYGLRIAYASTAVRIRWPDVAGLPTGRGVSRVPQLAEVREVERTFDLPLGLVAGHVGRADRVVRMVEDAGSVVGLASFDPSFPGCFPFRAREVAHMRTLLDALRPAALPGATEIQIVFEDSPLLADALVAAGGWRTMEFVHMRGSIASARRAPS